MIESHSVDSYCSTLSPPRKKLVLEVAVMCLFEGALFLQRLYLKGLCEESSGRIEFLDL